MWEVYMAKSSSPNTDPWGTPQKSCEETKADLATTLNEQCATIDAHVRANGEQDALVDYQMWLIIPNRLVTHRNNLGLSDLPQD